ncbi:MAG: hypothetical protein KBI40_02865 [Firmicutes bacterium]|nr:hypothetical protein [Candidatus Fermentithermobacillaceae bacterium]
MSLPDRYDDEQVLCIPARHLYSKVGRWRGLKMPTTDLWQTIARHSTFKPRTLVETDPSFKQLISYTLFISKKRVFVMKRLNTQTETRLQGLLSIGVGGHMNPVDDVPWPGRRLVSDLKTIVGLNTIREIREEVILCGNPSLSVIGFINDDENDVGTVHMGVASIVQLPSPILAVRETDKMMGGWVDLSAATTLDPLETWSSLILANIT